MTTLWKITRDSKTAAFFDFPSLLYYFITSYMSRHSKNNTSQSIFTYGEKQKLKGVYGSKE